MEFEAEIWKYEGPGGWHFVTVPGDIGFQIKAENGFDGPGWGMIKVRATVQGASVETSIFPDKTSGSYLLPLKASLRKAARLAAGDTIRVRLNIIA
ncbi:hypothetical protein ABID16_000631 [Rhizobium aquaticum]|uniref:DUF1905 domain-containing protein n=1 Tax=Rhizobium aquaticum TaxID=1549636 RepID=A0ABV2IW26_9HYPH